MAREEKVTAIERTYTVVFQPCERGYGYTVTCPALPGVVSEGDTLEEARANAREAIELYIESLQEDGLPIPPNEEDHIEPIRVVVTAKV